jgi:hypothetical protein
MLRAAFASLVLCGLVSTSAQAQEVSFNLPQGATLNEVYSGPRSEGVKASGQVLAGVSLGHSQAPFQADRIAVLRPSQVEWICLRIETIDGRYWSLDKFQADGRNGAVGVVRLPSEHIAELSHYRAEDVAVRVLAGQDCTELSEGMLLPTLSKTAARPTTLTLLVNAGTRRAAARIEGSEAWAPCQPIADRATVAFTHECEVPLGAAAGAATGEVKVDVVTLGLTGSRDPRTYSIRLSAQ